MTGTPSKSETVLKTTSLTKTYDGVDAVASLDLAVPANSIYGFLGPNGAGKTTTMKMLLGLIQPTSGTGSIFGLDVTTDSADVRRRIGYLPQDPQFYPHMSARETLRFAADFFFSGPSSGIDKRVNEMLELVGIAGKADRPIRTLSGGETQRLGIAQAQIHEPELLILDEPAAALDPLGRRDVLAILERFKSRATVFYSTHILEDVQRISDEICILRAGRIIRQGPLVEVLSSKTDSVFTVDIEGDVDRARIALAKEPWVDGVSIDDTASATQLRVEANDPEQAQARLQRILLADQNLIVKGFTRQSASLEEVFVELVEGNPAEDEN